MNKVSRAGILSLTFVLAFMFMAAFTEVAAAGRFIPLIDRGQLLTQSMRIQPKHYYPPFLDLNKHEVKLTKGQSSKLKVFLNPSGISVSVRWYSSNSDIAKVSDSGEVTAVAPGAVRIYVESEQYYGITDETGPSDICFVTVSGDAKDTIPLGKSDWTFSYGNKKLTVPTGKYKEALASVKKSIGGNVYYDMEEYRTGLVFGAKEFNKAHTFIFYNGSADSAEYSDGYGFIAKEKSLIKTSRGITVGAKESEVHEKYGLPTGEYSYTEGYSAYQTKTAGKNLFTTIVFKWSSKNTVSEIYFILGTQSYYNYRK